MKVYVKKRRLKVVDHNGEIVEMDVLVGEDEATKKYIDRRSDGQILVTDIKMARNYENHKRFFSFLKIAFEMQEFYKTTEMFRHWMTVACGHFNILVNPDGVTTLIPKSLSFENMDEIEFKKLFDSAIDVFLEEFGGAMSDKEFIKIIEYD